MFPSKPSFLNLMTLGEYFAIPGKVPSPEAFYELIFMTEEGMKTFEVFANFV